MLDIWDMKSRALLELGRTRGGARRAQEDGRARARGGARALRHRGREPVPAAREVGRGAAPRRGASRSWATRRADDIAARAALGKGDYAAAEAAARRAAESGNGQGARPRLPRPRADRRHPERPRGREGVVGEGGGALRRRQAPAVRPAHAARRRPRALGPARSRRRRNSSRSCGSIPTGWTPASPCPLSTPPSTAGRTRAG